jgi:hypothetical protein
VYDGQFRVSLSCSSRKRLLVNYKEEAKYYYYDHTQVHHLDYLPLIDVLEIYRRHISTGKPICQAILGICEWKV